jgi:hypothetical protein
MRVSRTHRRSRSSGREGVIFIRRYILQVTRRMKTGIYKAMMGPRTRDERGIHNKMRGRGATWRGVGKWDEAVRGTTSEVRLLSHWFVWLLRPSQGLRERVSHRASVDDYQDLSYQNKGGLALLVPSAALGGHSAIAYRESR